MSAWTRPVLLPVFLSVLTVPAVLAVLAVLVVEPPRSAAGPASGAAAVRVTAAGRAV
ncbi:hypothetical protein G3I46_36445, partial [Streptomyces coelicoflavus]|nr:hypothetical protein [Streptomyces coelicoflavus]